MFKLGFENQDVIKVILTNTKTDTDKVKKEASSLMKSMLN